MGKSKWENFVGQDMSFLSQYPETKNFRDFAVKLCDDQSKRFQMMKSDWSEIALTDWEDKWGLGEM